MPLYHALLFYTVAFVRNSQWNPHCCYRYFFPSCIAPTQGPKGFPHPPILTSPFNKAQLPPLLFFFLFWAWASSLKWLPTVSQMEKFWIGSPGSGRCVWRRNQKMHGTGPKICTGLPWLLKNPWDRIQTPTASPKILHLLPQNRVDVIVQTSWHLTLPVSSHRTCRELPQKVTAKSCLTYWSLPLL